jgi:hypothetical protein
LCLHFLGCTSLYGASCRSKPNWCFRWRPTQICSKAQQEPLWS